MCKDLLRMFGFLSNLKKKDADPQTPEAASNTAPTGDTPAGDPGPAHTPPKPAEPSKPIDFPLSALLESIPKSISAQFRPDPNRAALFRIPENIILDRLATGAIRFPYNEFRLFADPPFAPAIPAEANTLVEIPIGQALPRLTPGALRRRQDQRRVEVPSDLPAICSPQTFSAIPAPKPPPAPAPAGPDPAPAPAAAAAVTDPAPAPPPKNGGIPVPVHILEKAGVQPLAAAVAGLKGHFLVPTPLIEAGLRNGRIQTLWRDAREWWVPGDTHDLLPTLDPDAVVEFPLVYLAPEFIRASRRATPGDQTLHTPKPTSGGQPSPLPAVDLDALASRPGVESLLLVSGAGGLLRGGPATNPLLATAPQILRGVLMAMGAGPTATAQVTAGGRQLAILPAGPNYLVALSKPNGQLPLPDLLSAAAQLGQS